MRKNELLRLLRSGEYISGEKLGKALGISRVAVCKIIAALREDGFLIDAVPNRGYCLLRQELSQEQLAALLPETDWRFQVLRETAIEKRATLAVSKLRICASLET